MLVCIFTKYLVIYRVFWFVVYSTPSIASPPLYGGLLFAFIRCAHKVKNRK